MYLDCIDPPSVASISILQSFDKEFFSQTFAGVSVLGQQIPSPTLTLVRSKCIGAILVTMAVVHRTLVDIWEPNRKDHVVMQGRLSQTQDTCIHIHVTHAQTYTSHMHTHTRHTCTHIHITHAHTHTHITHYTCTHIHLTHEHTCTHLHYTCTRMHIPRAHTYKLHIHITHTRKHTLNMHTHTQSNTKT